MSIHHLQIWVPDLPRAEASWGWLLGELGYELARSWEHGRVWRHEGSTTAIVIESSPDMVPGMLFSRLRPGMNHVAFHVADSAAIAALAEAAGAHGWQRLGGEGGHPLPRDTAVLYLEDRDGFEVELIAPSAEGPGGADAASG